MEIKCLINEGFDFEGKIIRWNEKRELIRKKLGSKYDVQDSEFEGVDGKVIYSRRDVYTNYNNGDNYFFLNYSKSSELIEVEFHWGIKIAIGNNIFEFDQDVPGIVERLSKEGYKVLEVNSGSYIVPDIRVTFMDANNIGSDGRGLSYFYSGKDISHAIEEYEEMDKNS